MSTKINHQSNSKGDKVIKPIRNAGIVCDARIVKECSVPILLLYKNGSTLTCAAHSGRMSCLRPPSKIMIPIIEFAHNATHISDLDGLGARSWFTDSYRRGCHYSLLTWLPDERTIESSYMVLDYASTERQ